MPTGYTIDEIRAKDATIAALKDALTAAHMHGYEMGKAEFTERVRKLNIKLDDAMNKQSIDQKQCDEMTAEAAKLAEENHKLHRHIIKQDATIAALKAENERLKAIFDRVISHIDETARGPYYIAIPRLYGELGKILRGEEP